MWPRKFFTLNIYSGKICARKKYSNYGKTWCACIKMVCVCAGWLMLLVFLCYEHTQHTIRPFNMKMYVHIAYSYWTVGGYMYINQGTQAAPLNIVKCMYVCMYVCMYLYWFCGILFLICVHVRYVLYDITLQNTPVCKH